jgi:hypothetical protein
VEQPHDVSLAAPPPHGVLAGVLTYDCITDHPCFPVHMETIGRNQRMPLQKMQDVERPLGAKSGQLYHVSFSKQHV